MKLSLSSLALVLSSVLLLGGVDAYVQGHQSTPTHFHITVPSTTSPWVQGGPNPLVWESAIGEFGVLLKAGGREGGRRKGASSRRQGGGRERPSRLEGKIFSSSSTNEHLSRHLYSSQKAMRLWEGPLPSLPSSTQLLSPCSSSSLLVLPSACDFLFETILTPTLFLLPLILLLSRGCGSV